MIQSTKPFRRAGALLLANLYLFGMGIYFNICEFVARKAHSQFTIDPLENPITFRARRVIRNRNVPARKSEFLIRNTILQGEISNQRNQIELKIKNSISEKSTKHSQAIDNWMWDFEEDVRAQKAHQRQIESQEYEKRVLEAAAAEKARQEAYKQQRAAEIEAGKNSTGDSPFMAELRGREDEYNRLNPSASYGDRVVITGVHLKSLPAMDMRTVAIMQPYALLSVDGWVNSEVVMGNGIWFRIKASNDFPQGAWVWSGAVNTQTTSGLQDLNETPETEVLMSMGGPIAEYVMPTKIERQIEIFRNRKNTEFYTSYPPALADSKEGDRWFNTAENHRLYIFNGQAWMPHSNAITGAQFSNGGMVLSAEKLVVGSIDASHLNRQVGSVTRNGTTYQQFPSYNQYGYAQGSNAEALRQIDQLAQKVDYLERQKKATSYTQYNSAVATDMNNLALNIALGLGPYNS